MPHFVGETLVVTKEELVPVFWSSYQSLHRRYSTDAKKGYGLVVFQHGGGADTPLLIVFDSLPKRYQEQIGDPRIPDHILEKYYTESPHVYDYYNGFQYPDGSYLVPDTIDKLIINANVLNAVLKLEIARTNERISKGGTTRGIAKTLFDDVFKFQKTLLNKYHYQHTLNTNEVSFKRQLKAFKKGGEKSLIKDADGNSKMNALKIDEAHSNLLNSIFAGRDGGYKPNATEAAREYEAFLNGYIEIGSQKTGEIYNPKNYKPLSIGAITYHLRLYQNKVGNEAKRSGDRQKLMQKFVPYESLEQPEFAGSMISIDDRQPPFEYDKGKRMWWYIGIDLASEAIVAWAYGKTKEELIINFYRQLVVNFYQFGVNIPDTLECESSLNSSFKNTFLQNGAMFNEVQIHPNSARSKRIEAYFKPLRYGIEKKQEGWIARPFARAEANQMSSDKKTIIPYKDLVIQGFGNIQTWNNMPNSRDKSISRFDYFMNRQNPELRPTNWKSFMHHLGYKTQTSCNAGFVKLQRSERVLGDKGTIYTGEKLVRLLKEVEGKTVDVYWLDDDNGNVIKSMIYDADGRYICELFAKPISARAPIERTTQHIEAREIMSRYRATVTAYMQQRKNAIEKVTVIGEIDQTISNSFTIPGLEKFKVKERKTPVESFEDTQEEWTYKPQEHTAGESLRNAFN